MPKGHEIDEWMPLFIEIWLTSPAIRAMTAEQRGWYIELLIRAWKNSEMPCHLRYDETRLWMQAGARSKEYFARHSGLVIEQFVRMQREGSEWIVQPDQLEIYTNQLAKYRVVQAKGRAGGLAKASRAVAQLEPSLQTTVYISKSNSDSSFEKKERKRLDGFNATECAKFVSDSPGIDYVGKEAQWLYQDIIEKENKLTGVTCENIAEVMVSSRNEYLAVIRPPGSYVWPCKGFFAQGIWKKPEDWCGTTAGNKADVRSQTSRDSIKRAFEVHIAAAGDTDASGS